MNINDYEVLGIVRVGYDRFELPLGTKFCSIPFEGIRVPVYEQSLLTSDDLGVVFIVFCEVKAYTQTIIKE